MKYVIVILGGFCIGLTGLPLPAACILGFMWGVICFVVSNYMVTK
jgi:hypothetical protein